MILTSSLRSRTLGTPYLSKAVGRATASQLSEIFTTSSSSHPKLIRARYQKFARLLHPKKFFTFLTIARGNLSYSCTSASPSSAPLYNSQQTALYDVAPLIQYYPTETTLHSLVPQLRSYDYAELNNSSLVCIGKIYTQLGKTTVDLTGSEPFFLQVNATVSAPSAQANSYWAQSLSQEYDWEVYRVGTAGGAIPSTCAGLPERIQIGYAAEYWFYHS